SSKGERYPWIETRSNGWLPISSVKQPMELPPTRLSTPCIWHSTVHHQDRLLRLVHRFAMHCNRRKCAAAPIVSKQSGSTHGFCAGCLHKKSYYVFISSDKGDRFMLSHLQSLIHYLAAAWPTCHIHPKQRLCSICGGCPKCGECTC